MKKNTVKLSCQHPFHLVDYSPWPFLTAWGAFSVAVGIISYSHKIINGGWLLFFSFLYLLLCVYFWVRDVIFEGTYEGHHTKAVLQGLRLGFLLFIASEVMFFVSFFWAFFHSALAPSIWIGNVWPPKGIECLYPFTGALFNTLILLTSGATVTWSHYALIAKNRREAILGLFATIGLGLLFTLVQGYEYYYCEFSINDGIYGSCFYMLTGFHGLHVIIGTIFLIVCAFRLVFYHFTSESHLGFLAAIWYWHFVDVVWIFVYLIIYLWSAPLDYWSLSF